MKEVTKDTMYDVPLVLPDRRTVTLRVHFGKDFPNESPSLQVLPAFSHPLLIPPHGFVVLSAHERLGKKWDPASDRLGKVVFEVCQLFGQDSPAVSTPTPTNTTTMAAPSYPSQFASGLTSKDLPPPYPVTSSNPFSSQPTIPQPQQTQQIPQASKSSKSDRHIPLPPVPTHFPTLQSKTLGELQKISADDSLLDDFVSTLDCVTTVKSVRDDLVNNNQQTKDMISKKEEEILGLKMELDSKQREIKEKREMLDRIMLQQVEIAKEYSAEELARKLYVMMEEGDKNASDMSGLFLQQTSNFPELIKQYFALRCTYHQRAAKRESFLLQKHM